MMGAHVIKVGLSRFVIDLMERGIVTHVGMNGAGPIHDFELALIGATTESVARYIQEGQFGLWDETGRINDIVAEGVAMDWASARRWASDRRIGRIRISRRKPDSPSPTATSASSPRATGCACPVTVHIGIGL